MADPAGTIDLATAMVDPSWMLKIPASLTTRRLAIPLSVVDGKLVVAMANPSDEQTAGAISKAAGLEVQVAAADAGAVRTLLAKVYGDMRQYREGGDDPVSIVEGILRAATLRKASDIHLDPDRDGLRVRLRVDGALEDFIHLGRDVQPSVTSRIKVMSKLDIAERRAPQDGAFTWRMPGARPSEASDVRVATLPVRYGEKLTLRLLESGGERMTVDRLGMGDSDLAVFDKILSRPHGLVLMTGPTGSGKSTTLYAAITRLMERSQLNILTVEDPVEYEIDGVSQAEVDSSDKVNFSKALKSLLRHDPDVVMIGEIRDRESMDTAVKAALTGHLVLSTLHTNDAVSTVTRLLDMGMEPHMVGAVLRLSAAQRLVRRLCPFCREAYPLSEAEALALGDGSLAGREAFKARGCVKCAGRGYAGRIGIFELMAPDAEVASLVSTGLRDDALFAKMRTKGMRTLLEDAVAKVLSGTTSASEAIRVLGGAC